MSDTKFNLFHHIACKGKNLRALNEGTRDFNTTLRILFNLLAFKDLSEGPGSSIKRRLSLIISTSQLEHLEEMTVVVTYTFSTISSSSDSVLAVYISKAYKNRAC